MKLKTKVKLLGAVACFVFLLSIFIPFLQAVWQGGIFPELPPGPETFWSFKATFEDSHMILGRIVHEYWFFDYWFLNRISQYGGLGLWIGPALILTFASQILVLLFSAIAILLDKGRLFICSIILNAVTVSCMLLVTYALDHNYERHPVAGFWLTILAAALFTVAFFMSRRRLDDALKPR